MSAAGRVSPLFDPFADLAALGYGPRLVPVMPPSAEIEPGSDLERRFQKRDDRGKAPGVRKENGYWTTIKNWQRLQPTPDDLRAWRAMGANAGIRCGDPLLAIDVDILDETWAARVEAEITRRLGLLPKRVGRAPKALYLMRVSDDFALTKTKCEHGEVDYRTGGQFVAKGMHKSGKLYEWPVPLVALDALPVVDRDAVVALSRALDDMLPGARTITTHVSAGGPPPDPRTLRGDETRLRLALSAIANDDRCSREVYIRVAYACRGASGGEAWGRAALQDWAATWTEGENDPEVVDRDFDSAAETHIGIGWLEHFAGGMSGGAFSAQVSRFFEPIDEDAAAAPPPTDSLFPEEKPYGATIGIDATPYACPDPGTIPPRQSLYGGHYVRQFLSSTLAQSKVGKSTLIVAEILAMASGKALLGVPVKKPLRVWWHNGEDPIDEMVRRIAAAMIRYGLTEEDIEGRLFISSGRRTPIVFATHDNRAGTKLGAETVAGVKQFIRENRIDVAVFDPFVSVHRVPENDNGAIELVAKTLANVADETRSAIEVVHHTRKGNGIAPTVEDGRGASALLAATRSSRALARITEDDADKRGASGAWRSIFRFADVSSNLYPPPSGEGADKRDPWIHIVEVNLKNGEGEDIMDKEAGGDRVGVATAFSEARARAEEAASAAAHGSTHQRETAALAALSQFQWRYSWKSDEWAGVPVGRAYGLDPRDKTDRRRIEQIIEGLIADGRLAISERMTNARQMKKFVEVVKSNVFD